jgi:hypothetical protein
MTQSESIAQLAPAFVAAQAAIEAAKKDAENPFFKSNYADLAEVWRVVKAAFAPQGLSILQFPEAAEDGSVTLTTTILHESGEWMAGTMPVRVAKDDPQGVGSGLTYARRYALAAMCGVVADEDDDGEAAMGRGVQPGKTQRVKAAPREAPPQDKPGTIGEAGRKQLVALCVDAEREGGDKAMLTQLVLDYASAAGKKIAELTIEEGAEVRDMIADALNQIQEAAA